MKAYEVTMYEGERIIRVRVRATSASNATRRAERLCPDAVPLASVRVSRDGR